MYPVPPKTAGLGSIALIQKSAFKPAWWLPGPHAQTIWSSIFRRKSTLQRRRERFTLRDGDFVDLDWVDPAGGSQVTVMILHGLTGSSDSNYAWGLQAALRDRGWRSVVLNFRGCSGEPNRLPRAYHSGETGDVGEVFSFIHDRSPEHTFATVGYSLGGNVLLKWLGESGKDSRVTAAVAVSVPYLLDRCQKRLSEGFSRVYQRRLLRQLQNSVEDKKEAFRHHRQQTHLQALQALGNIARYQNLYDFDEFVTAPLHGFQGANDYYRRCSSLDFLTRIQVPTLLLHALNDPFIAENSVPGPQHLGEHVTLELSQGGGHVGFVAGHNPMRPTYWLEQRIPDFLASRLDADAG